MFAFRRPSPSRTLLLAILIAALQCAHWQGLAHRLGHASRVIGGSELSVPAGVDAAASASIEQAGHSCLAFDAATVGAVLASPCVLIDPPRFAPVTAVWLAFISWLVPFTPHFSSRAPPAL